MEINIGFLIIVGIPVTIGITCMLVSEYQDKKGIRNKFPNSFFCTVGDVDALYSCTLAPMAVTFFLYLLVELFRA